MTVMVMARTTCASIVPGIRKIARWATKLVETSIPASHRMPVELAARHRASRTTIVPKPMIMRNVAESKERIRFRKPGTSL